MTPISRDRLVDMGDRRAGPCSSLNTSEAFRSAVKDHLFDPALRRRLFDLARALARGADRVSGN
jgi:hypothetical protein